jgi:hypothetical protein
MSCTQRRRKWSLTTAGVAAVVLALGCGEGEVPRDGDLRSTGEGTDFTAALQVRVTSEGIRPDTLRMAIGDTVHLRISNDGPRPVEFMIGRIPMESSFEVPFFADVTMLEMDGPIVASEVPTGNGPVRTSGRMQHPQAYFYLRSGESASTTFIVPAGHEGVWQMACFIDGHDARRLRGVVLVTPGRADGRRSGS